MGNNDRHTAEKSHLCDHSSHRCEKTASCFCSHFPSGHHHLPRQARDKHSYGILRKTICRFASSSSSSSSIAAKSIFLHRASPSLFWTGICIPVPFCVILNTLAWGWYAYLGSPTFEAHSLTHSLTRTVAFDRCEPVLVYHTLLHVCCMFLA